MRAMRPERLAKMDDSDAPGPIDGGGVGLRALWTIWSFVVGVDRRMRALRRCDSALPGTMSPPLVRLHVPKTAATGSARILRGEVASRHNPEISGLAGRFARRGDRLRTQRALHEPRETGVFVGGPTRPRAL